MDKNYIEGNLIQGKSGLWAMTIGLEVHAQIISKSKLFSGSSTSFGADANHNVSFIDAAMPGMLPVLNKECVRQAVKTGVSLNATINKFSVFDRKHYFYPDLPQGYQISQLYYPLVGEGYLEVDLPNNQTKKIAIERIHIEQDAGKNIHAKDASYIDLNRAGVGLMEIVTKPDIKSAIEAVTFMKELRALLRCIGTCDGNMEEGSMRADVNISLARPNEPLGTRAEIKNINSMRFMNQAIEFEIKRQLNILEKGGQVEQETRLFDAKTSTTRTMRTKEDANDYRYFPDPDLPPLIIKDQLIAEIRASLPELPRQKRNRLINDYKLSTYDATVLSAEKENMQYFENAVTALGNNKNDKTVKLLANWMLTELFAKLNHHELGLGDGKIPSQDLSELIVLIYDGTISGKIAKDIFEQMWESQSKPSEIVEQKGLMQISNEKQIQDIVQSVLNQHSQEVLDYKNGKERLFGFFIGQIMKETKGKANPGVVNKVLRQLLK